MKNYSYIGVALIIVIFGILVIPEIIDRVNEKEVVSSNRSDTRDERAAAAEELAYIEIDGEAKKVPAFEFVNQEGDTISNETYKGKVYVVEFFFSTCPSICPIMKENLLEVQEEFKNENDLGIASFSIDATYDTPAVLKKYAATNGISHPNWHLMTGDGEKIFELANQGFNIYAGEDSTVPGGFAHSGYFALIDREGFLRSRKDQYGNPIIYYRGSVEKDAVPQPGEETPQTEELIQDIKNLLKDGI
ncbi:SCO family protein [Salinimicrobium soli]|uniref:SCO family protein n=1 Tax=Salinimicrobium soli TaxID=1254399 RepID=UPI003AAA8A6E